MCCSCSYIFHGCSVLFGLVVAHPGLIVVPLALFVPTQVMLLIDIELSYINTNHEDFIGFAKYVPPLLGSAAPPQ